MFAGSEGKLKGSKTKESTETTKSQKKSSKSDKPEVSETSIDKLANIMVTGFRDLQNIIREQASVSSVENEYDWEEVEDIGSINSEYEEQDFFKELAGTVSDGETFGPSVRPSLASLADQLLHLKVSDNLLKEKRTAHVRPQMWNVFILHRQTNLSGSLFLHQHV